MLVKRIKIDENITEYYLLDKTDYNYKNILDWLQRYVEEHNLIIVNSYIFSSIKDQVIYDLRKKFPVSIISWKYDNGFQIQFSCIEKNDYLNFESIENNSQKFGYYLLDRKSNNKYLYLDGIRFNDLDFEIQCEKTYQFIFECFDKYWFTVKDYVRAWNFIQNIFDNYATFNKVRNKYFEKYNLFSDYPAGTWIWAVLDDDFIMNTCAFAVSSASIVHQANISKRQVQAFSYGPKFSRSRLLEYWKTKKLFVSWTASVDKDWKWAFTDDILKNIQNTFDIVESLLDNVEMWFDNIVSCFVYLKEKWDLEYFEKIYKMWNYSFPYIYVYNDICQKYFLFEMECIAVKSFN